MEWFYTFDCCDEIGLREVGGKGLSLIQMSRRDFPVPPGFVLSTKFFEPWFGELKKKIAWKNFLETKPDTVKKDCLALQASCPTLIYNSRQEAELKSALAWLRERGGDGTVAVRSSSPEEDLEGASFAGGYETILGVPPGEINQAIRTAFASCLSERVYLYKQEHNFPLHQPSLAVIVQVQLSPRAAGVAFSMNPLNNCYDEVVINANFGLGESVVAGQISPDQFVVDKNTHEILDSRLGGKQTIIRLRREGGTFAKASGEGKKFCLNHSQVLELTTLVNSVEAYYGKPMDLEWALEEEKFYLLQARPVTAYVPLPPDMITPPGAQKYLYLDMFLAKQGIHEAFSVLGLDYMEHVQRELFRGIFGSDAPFSRKNGIAFNSGGRSYIHLSHTIKLQGKERAAWSVESQDVLSAQIIRALDVSAYVPAKLPGILKNTLWKVLTNNIQTIRNAVRAFRHPEESHVTFLGKTESLVQRLQELDRREGDLKRFVLESLRLYCHYVNKISLPITYAAEMARSRIKKLFIKEPREVRDKIAYLEQALPHNITIEMGLALYDLSGYPDVLLCSSEDDFAGKLEQKALSPEFLRGWSEYMERYGHRCPRELDAAVPRFFEQPREVYRQLRILAETTDAENNPRRIFEDGRNRRKKVYHELLGYLGGKEKRKGRKFAGYYKILETLGAYREVHKYHFIRILAMFRRRVLQLADEWVTAGRLATREEVFKLRLQDLEVASRAPEFDFTTASEKNTVFLKKLKGFTNFPRIIDSRGRIFTSPPRKAGEGELAGEPISPGRVRGKVKVLHHPAEKTLQKGDILVARATDPGWTPLFLNASGIVLEVGGVLQHGALVAREYCKPCVAGIANVVERLCDGQEVEVDGDGGIVRIIS